MAPPLPPRNSHGLAAVMAAAPWTGGNGFEDCGHTSFGDDETWVLGRGNGLVVSGMERSVVSCCRSLSWVSYCLTLYSRERI